MNPFRGIVSPIVVLGLVAVLSASTGAVAGQLVTSADIKDRTIKVVDISPGAVKALKGKRGPRGAQGKAGTPGRNGSALAYAHVSGAAKLLPGSKGLSVSFEDSGEPHYCLTYAGGPPHVVIATADVSSGALRLDAIATTDPTFVADGCSAGGNIVVYVTDGMGAYTEPFYIAVMS